MLIRNSDTHIWNIAGAVVLLPGNNEVDEEVWNRPEVKNSASHLVEAGLLEVREDVSVKKLSGFKDAEAIRIVKETVDRPLLESWLADRRGAVRRAVEAQIAAITPEPPKTDKGPEGAADDVEE